MPYTKSLARKTIDIEIVKMISIIKDTLKNKSISSDTRDYVLSCCIMLGSAKMEVYFEDFFDSWIQKVNALNLTSTQLPKNLRAVYLNQLFLVNGFKKLLFENNEPNYIELISNGLSDVHFHLTDESKCLPRLSAKKIYQNKKYPSPDNLNTMFKRVGINKVFNELNKSAKLDIKNLLQSYNDFRTAIAHNGIPTGINQRDVIDKLKDLQIIVYHIDKMLFRHLIKYTTMASWTI
ncbi:hypothetical protein SAMN05216490_4271 [Mucilaginibacter mallensis]|uniref:RiboL-PSP-HEPN domain-containing protein n=1 Tax=Mucilaginibacter mallensis TaxID=652787 RepID=A0A1H2BQB7_MUCMA|nr:HEPN domain-containing protein [Mucilaginibacter mallensis]SDT60398.1 hypothetical protein SAMN05216490_4271 [Mucilaginibacter mallensis]